MMVIPVPGIVIMREGAPDWRFNVVLEIAFWSKLLVRPEH
jgi:hypothetical protein